MIAGGIGVSLWPEILANLAKDMGSFGVFWPEPRGAAGVPLNPGRTEREQHEEVAGEDRNRADPP